jgi:hypothetical protein
MVREIPEATEKGVNQIRIRVHYTFKRLICIADASTSFTAAPDYRGDFFAGLRVAGCLSLSPFSENPPT